MFTAAHQSDSWGCSRYANDYHSFTSGCSERPSLVRTFMPMPQSWNSEISPDFFLTVVLTQAVCYPVTNKASKSMNVMGHGLRTWWIVKIWQEAGKFSFSHVCMQNSNSIESEGSTSTQGPTDTKQFFKYFTGAWFYRNKWSNSTGL